MNDATTDADSSSTDDAAGSDSTTQGQQGFIPPKDGSWVPIDRLNEVIASKGQTERELVELRNEVGTLKKAAEAPKEYSRAELGQFVDDGRMTQDEADRVIERQATHRIQENVTATVTQTMQQQQQGQAIQAEVNRYKAVIPEVTQAGTAERARVETEYQYLVGIGNTPDASTELTALRSVYGPVESLQKGERQETETHQETGGGQSETGKSTNTDGAPAGLTTAEKSYYQDQIGKGIYAGWDQVKDEMKFANQGLRKRTGARG